MAKIKMDKHMVYTYIIKDLDFFKRKSNPSNLLFRSCQAIESNIYSLLFIESGGSGKDAPDFKLYGATLTAMVYDGVLEREFNEVDRRYCYRPILPINEDYISG